MVRSFRRAEDWLGASRALLALGESAEIVWLGSGTAVVDDAVPRFEGTDETFGSLLAAETALELAGRVAEDAD